MFTRRSTLIVLTLLLAPFALAGCGGDKTSSPVTNQVDTVPPTVPSVWQPRAVGATTVLRWAKNAETDLAGYNLYKYDPNPQDQNSYVVVNSQPLVTNRYAVESPAPGVTYYYRTTAVDMSGNESGYSQVMAVTLEDDGQSDKDYPRMGEM